jgi:hypothetical protein
MLLGQRRKQDFAEVLFGGGESGRYNAELLHRLKFDLPLDDLQDGTWAKKTRPVPAKEKPQSKARTASCPNSQRSAIVPVKEIVGDVSSRGVSPKKPQKSSLIKANQGKKVDTNPAEAEPVKPAGAEEIKASRNGKDRPPRTEEKPADPVGQPAPGPEVSGQPQGPQPMREEKSAIYRGSKISTLPRFRQKSGNSHQTRPKKL